MAIKFSDKSMADAVMDEMMSKVKAGSPAEKIAAAKEVMKQAEEVERKGAYRRMASTNVNTSSERPKNQKAKTGRKTKISLWVSNDVLAYFHTYGAGWQTFVDECLRNVMDGGIIEDMRKDGEIK